jgi:hypothetical protein
LATVLLRRHFPDLIGDQANPRRRRTISLNKGDRHCFFKKLRNWRRMIGLLEALAPCVSVPLSRKGGREEGRTGRAEADKKRKEKERRKNREETNFEPWIA